MAKTRLGTLLRLFIIPTLLCGLAGPASVQGCILGLSEVPFDSSANCSSQPEIDRAFTSEVMHWKGNVYLLANIGNDIKMWSLEDPDDPVYIDESYFNIPNVSDSDYDLMNFSVVDEGRFGIANYKAATVLFDLGTGNVPFFDDFSANFDANLVIGGFTFIYQDQQYLIASNLEGACTSGDSTLYKYNGINELTDLESVGCVEADPVATTAILGGHYVNGYLYLGDKTTRVFVHRIDTYGSAITLQYLSTPFTAGMSKGSGLAVDTINNVAIEANNTGAAVWDISNPGSPVERSTISGTYRIAAVSFPFAFIARKGFQHSEKTFDITDLSSPQPLDQDFWSDTNPWNYPDHLCAEIYGATFSPPEVGGPLLYLARYSLLQIADLSDCPGQLPPTAGLTVTPDPAFPGDTIDVAKTSSGLVERWAIWITDTPDPYYGAVVAGSPTLSASTPGALPFTIPVDLAAGQDYWAHVAVENDFYPYDPGGSTPGQMASQQITIDREPDVSIGIVPAGPITGDLITLTAAAEGHPMHPSGGEAYEWLITDPLGVQTGDSGQSVSVLLDQSGLWTFQLIVHYAHETAGGWLHDAVAQEQRSISSVHADFTYLPSDPLTTEILFLDAGSSIIAAGGVPSYDWSITGATTYFGCPDSSTCTIQADTLNPGLHNFELVLTNTNNGDQSSKTYSNVYVQYGSIQLDFGWTPSDPAIGEMMVFQITGVSADLDSATWNFGGSPCPGSGFTNPHTCYPGIYNDCMNEAYQYGTSGSKSVALSVVIDGLTYGPVYHTVAVANSGGCGATIFVDGFEAGDSSAWAITVP